MVKKEEGKTQQLVDTIVEGIFRKKGQDVVCLDMTKIENSVCKNFIICHADSNTQVDAISDSIDELVKENLNEKSWHIEGRDNSTWILMDYSDVVVHIFQKEYRNLYKLEDLWADATIKKYEDVA